MIRVLINWWALRRKPYGVALVGLHSGNQYPPREFLRFRSFEEAEVWILQRQLDEVDRYTERLTKWIAVDLRVTEQDQLLR